MLLMPRLTLATTNARMAGESTIIAGPRLLSSTGMSGVHGRPRRLSVMGIGGGCGRFLDFSRVLRAMSVAPGPSFLNFSRQRTMPRIGADALTTGGCRHPPPVFG